MKKLLTVVMALVLSLSLCLNVFADGEVEIPLDADHVGDSSAGGADVLTIADGSITASAEANIPLFSLKLPENVKLGDTVTIHIKGTSDDDFRVWLLGDSVTDEKGSEATFSNQWKGSENGYTAPGEFEKYISLTAEDYDAQGGTEADRVAFKGPSFGVNLTNLKLTYVGVVYGSLDDIEGTAAQDAQPYLDAANAALEAANAAQDKSDIEAALDDAKAAVSSLEEAAELGFPSVTAMLDEAKTVVSKITSMLNASDSDEILESLQSDIDSVAAAVTASAAAGEDVDAASKALEDAKAALANIETAAKANPSYSALTAALTDARAKVKEIEANVAAAQEAKAAAEEAARIAEEEAAAAKQKTTVTVIAVVSVVVVIAIIAAVAVVFKKKKKNKD